MTAVMDASVLVRAALNQDHEPGADDARAIQPHLAERFGLAAPALCPYEVANVVHSKHPDRFGGSVEDRQRTVSLILSGVELVAPDPDLLERTGALSEAHGLTAYDAAYLALAEDRGDPSLLVTGDRALLAAGRATLGTDRALTPGGAHARIVAGHL